MLTKELTQVQKEKEKVEESIRERNVDISDAKNQLKEKGDELSKLHDQEKIYKEELEKLKIGVNGSSSQLKALATKAELLLKKFNEAKANHSVLLEKIVKITAEREACQKSLEAMRSELGRRKNSQAKSYSTVKETDEGEYPDKKQINKVDEKKEEASDEVEVVEKSDTDVGEKEMQSKEVKQRGEEVSDEGDGDNKNDVKGQDDREVTKEEKNSSKKYKSTSSDVEEDNQKDDDPIKEKKIPVISVSNSPKTQNISNADGNDPASKAVGEPKVTAPDTMSKLKGDSKQDKEEEEQVDDQENVEEGDEDKEVANNEEEPEDDSDTMEKEMSPRERMDSNGGLDEGDLKHPRSKASRDVPEDRDLSRNYRSSENKVRSNEREWADTRMEMEEQ